jgi:outer membrane lipoprotein-sorting protein
MRNENFAWNTACAAMMWVIFLAGVPAPAACAQGETDAAKRGAEILSEATAAAGGEALKKVKSLEIKTTGSIQAPTGPMEVTVRVQVELPDKSRLEVDLGMALITSGFDGKAGWVVTPQGTIDMPADLNSEALRGIDLTGGVGLYKKSLAGKTEAKFGGEKEVAGQKTWLVEWTGPSGIVKLYFDATSKMLVAAKYRNTTMGGVFEEERRLSDFREVQGIKFPYRWVTYRDGTLFSDQTVTEVKVNATVDAGAFARPQ